MTASRHLPGTIYLVGFMSAGKSTVGRSLAALLGYSFIDTDLYIENRFRLRVSDIFARHGETYFRQKEHIILEELLGYPQAVIATGGGLPMHHDHMPLLLESGLVLYLRYSDRALAQRLSLTKRTRPTVAHLSDEELLPFVSERMALRSPVYEQAHIVVDMEAPHLSELHTSDEIARYLYEQVIPDM